MALRTTPRLMPQNGAAIREIREREGLSRRELAEPVGVSESHIRNLENEHKAARPEHLARIAKALHCSLASIRRDPVVTDAADGVGPDEDVA